MNNPRFVWVAVDSNGDERITSNEEGFQRLKVFKIINYGKD